LQTVGTLLATIFPNFMNFMKTSKKRKLKKK
jgi:hypothetical protein